MDLITTHLIEKPLTVNSVRITLRQIACEVAEKHGLSLDLMRSGKRLGPISAAKFEFYYRAATETLKSIPEIGRFIRVDHATVAYGVTRYCVQHRLPQPRNYKSMEKARNARHYPLSLSYCDERTVYAVDDLMERKSASTDPLAEKLATGCR